ncbi:hypothetical protein OV203_20415 [Nannocystis sp. ILAH1]|uniref:phosphorylase family protein n=1 Tax=Nannocystis sp. ILAH1 TaxID=2996789 RepID=UPI00226FB5BF|nr:hypothetical protein [Nannocystis sp. ILAH1]MCY0989516.1 hypothetical protein [Nannocystis sp. ILAH1]
MVGRRSENSIALGRTFTEVLDAGNDLTSDPTLDISRALNREKSWAQLLQHAYVVVLGEAGTGKSTEFGRQANELSKAGHWTFFLEINILASEGVSNSIDPEDEARLDAWRKTDEPAIFFLDSLDEAKLHKRTLREALRQLRKATQNELKRVRLVISCRVSDWMAHADRVEVQAFIPEGSEAKVHVVQLTPLKDIQVEKLARLAGVSNINAFMTAIRDNYAQIFVERPLDVKWLGGYWSRHQKLGSLRELIEDDIREKLKERPQRVSTLSATKAEKGLRALAGIATLTQRYSFLVPDERLDLERSTSSVDPHDVLPDWSDEDIQQLLRRPILDESTYGRVRIHHRVVQEFLAARWLKDLQDAGMPRSKFESLFLLKNEEGETTIPHHLGPVIAWLCLWEPDLRSKVISEAPFLLIAYGDPSGYSSDERCKILYAYARGYAGRARRFDRFDPACIERFSSPTLAKPTEVLLSNPETPEELAIILLQIIEYGRIRECAPIAMRMALDPAVGNRARFYAIRSAALLGNEVERKQLMNLVESTECWDQDVAGSLLHALYPDPLHIDGLIKLFSRVERKSRYSMTYLTGILETEIPTIGDVAHRLKLLQEMVAFISVVDGNGERTVPHNRQWLLPMVSKLVAGVLSASPSEPVLEALDLFRWCTKSHMHGWYGLEDVREAVTQHPEIRRILFWRSVEAHRQRVGITPTRQFEIRLSYEIFTLSAYDIPWLVQDACTREHVRERLLAFDVLVRLQRSDEGLSQRLDLLRVASVDPALRKRLERMNRPFYAVDHHLQIHERRRKANEIRREREHIENCRILAAQIGSIRSGLNINALWFLWNSARRASNTSAAGSYEALRAKYGEQIAEAARDGWRAIWRTQEPVLPHERDSPGRIPGTVILGLAGLDSEIADGLVVSQIGEALAARATGYAASEANHFPSWLGELASAYPQVVMRVLEPVLSAEYNSDETVHGVLVKLANGDERVRWACVPTVAKLIVDHDPPSLGTLGYALTAVLSTEHADVSMLDNILEPRCVASITEGERFAAWWCCWINRDSTRALVFLEQILAKMSNSDAYTLVEQVCHRIHEQTESSRHLPMAVLREPLALSRFLPIVCEYITYDLDITHEGAFTPTSRDHAQDLRNKLPGWIAAIPGPVTVAALRGVASDPRVEHSRDWLLHLAEQRVVADAGGSSEGLTSMLVQLFRQYGLDAFGHLNELIGERVMKIDVGILTMKEEEYDALLDKFAPSGARSGENRSYDVAEIDTPRGICRVAITRVAKQGNVYAQNAASEMLSDVAPSFVLVVGIGGGVPTPDFCLGDVVISDYIHDLTLEDTGATPEARRFSALGGPLHPKATRIVERLRAIERGAGSWSEPSSIGFDRPRFDGSHTTNDAEWNREINDAFQRNSERAAPKATAKAVASSDRLVKDPELLQQWRSVLKAVAAVEMESAGVYVLCQRKGVPVIAIRGISDIVGWKRDEAWTIYACHSAAAFTRMLIASGELVSDKS